MINLTENEMKYRKKPVVIDATRWFKNGDHPEDDCYRKYEDTGLPPQEPREGKIVRRYLRHPSKYGYEIGICTECGELMNEHGWIDTREGGHRVCPGDWIITGVENEHYPCKASIFNATYEPVS